MENNKLSIGEIYYCRTETGAQEPVKLIGIREYGTINKSDYKLVDVYFLTIGVTETLSSQLLRTAFKEPNGNYTPFERISNWGLKNPKPKVS